MTDPIDQRMGDGQDAPGAEQAYAGQSFDDSGGYEERADHGDGIDSHRLPVEPADFPDLAGSVAQPAASRDLRLLADIELELCVEIGRARLPLRQLLALTPGTVVELDRAIGEAVDVLVNGKLVAKGQVVTIGDEFGVRLSQIIDAGAVSGTSSSHPTRRG